jgi:hypothetical protein
VVQWDREAELDQDGNVIGFKDVMKVTPSRLLTEEQAAMVKCVTTKSGALKFEVHDKLAALGQLAKITGLTQDPTPQVTVNQLNVSQGPETALELARKLAFAIAAAEQAAQRSPPGPLIEGEKVVKSE